MINLGTLFVKTNSIVGKHCFDVSYDVLFRHLYTSILQRPGKNKEIILHIFSITLLTNQGTFFALGFLRCALRIMPSDTAEAP